MPYTPHSHFPDAIELDANAFKAAHSATVNSGFVTPLGKHSMQVFLIRIGLDLHYYRKVELLLEDEIYDNRGAYADAFWSATEGSAAAFPSTGDSETEMLLRDHARFELEIVPYLHLLRELANEPGTESTSSAMAVAQQVAEIARNVSGDTPETSIILDNLIWQAVRPKRTV